MREKSIGSGEAKMSAKRQKALHKRIQTGSRMITDPAGRDVQILEDKEALNVSEECGQPVPEVYRQALRLGVYPYRYIRNREAISLEEQLKLAESRVTVVGAGGLGGHVILLLARAGIGHLVVVDHDLFDETNLNRQALSSRKAIGKPKSQEAADVVGAINPGVEVTPIHGRLELSNAQEILAGSNAIVDALDNVPDRFVLEKVAKKMGIPLVHGALAGFEGRMMTIFPDDPGLQHLYGAEGRKGDDPKRPEAVLGVPTITPAIIAGFQSMEVLKIIFKRGRILRRVMVHVDLERGQLIEFAFKNTDS